VTDRANAQNRSPDEKGRPVHPLSLFVDQPAEDGWSVQGDLVVSGHIQGGDGAPMPSVHVQVSGGSPTAAVVTPSVAGQVPGRLDWKAHVDVSEIEPGLAHLTAMAGRAEEVVRRRLLVEPAAERRVGGSGFLDEPVDGLSVEGDTMLVRGWCLFDDSHVAKVEVFLDGVRVGRARPYVDVIVPGSEHKDSAVAGYEAYLNIRNLRKGRTAIVTVEATSLGGQIWAPAGHTVCWNDEEQLSTVELNEVAARNAGVLADIPNNRANVVVFTHDLGYGGGQLWLMELLRQARAQTGLPCRVITLADGPLRETLESMDIPVHVTTEMRVKNAFVHEGKVQELACLIKSINGGVVLANTITVFAAIEAAERAGVPSLWAIHESIDLGEYCTMAWGFHGMDPRVRQRIEAAFTMPKGLIFEASRTAELFGELRGPAPSYVVDYGVDVDEIDRYRASVQRAQLRASAGFQEEDRVVLVMGTFEPRKAQAAIVAVFDELLDVHESVHLVLVGANDTKYSNAVETQISRTRWHERIHVIPVTSEIFSWYELSDLLLCASDMESLPRSIIEAMAFELPVVSTDVYGIADLIDDGTTGWLTRDRDLEALAGLLHVVLDKSDSELQRVATAARAIAHARHGSQSYGKLIATAIQGLLDDPVFDVGSVLTPLESVPRR
jgi:D-inositol-3-phosphate glycosyltransferase